MSEASTFFEVYRAPNGKFYLTREDQLIRTQSGGIVLFERLLKPRTRPPAAERDPGFGHMSGNATASNGGSAPRSG